MTRPLIGLSGRRKKGSQIVGNPEILADLDLELYYSDYARGVLEAGGIPIHLPIDLDPADIMDRLDGVLLSGGADVDPTNYGHEPAPELDATEADRDAFELSLLDGAVANELPTLGICRGIQIINVHAGGTLHQHVPVHAGFDQPPTTELHEVEFEAESVLGGIYGSRKAVNSLHHQTLDTLGAGLRVTARADDGTVEGVEHQELPVVAVQWHPEMMVGRSTDPVFRWLVEAARR